ncbi:MAG: hypothetical protein ACKVX7_03640 [Planctomycetota bacterium]
MGAKGPLIILVLGCLAVGSMGILAKMAIEQAPGVKAALLYGEQLEKEYRASSVEITREGEVFKLALHDVGEPDVLSADWSLDPKTNNKKFLVGFRAGAGVRPLPSVLNVNCLRSGGGCRAAQVESSYTYEPATDFANIVQPFGFAADLKYSDLLIGSEEFRVRLKKSLPAAEMQALAAALSVFWGGGWSKIQITAGSRTRHYDGTGRSAGNEQR